MQQYVDSVFNRRRCQTVNDQPSMTQQHFADQCNMRTILERSIKRGQIPVMQGDPRFMDCTGDFDYHTTQNKISQANQAFASLPSSLRELFANDPANLISFLSDEKNYDDALALGLVQPREKEKTQNVDPTSGKTSNSINSTGSGELAQPLPKTEN